MLAAQPRGHAERHLQRDLGRGGGVPAAGDDATAAARAANRSRCSTIMLVEVHWNLLLVRKLRQKIILVCRL